MDLTRLSQTATTAASAAPFRLTREISRPVASETQPTPVAELDDRSLFGMVGDAALSGLGMAGNLLDLPGSMVRDTLAGENPFDQWLNPFSHWEEGASVTGRDVLTKWGVTGPNKATGISGWVDDPYEAVADLAGFGFELGTDPFGWATGFIKGSAKSLARESIKKGAVRRPGIMGGLARAGDGALNVVNTLDPGYHVGRIADKVAGKQIRRFNKKLARGAAAGFQNTRAKTRRWLDKYELGPADLEELEKDLAGAMKGKDSGIPADARIVTRLTPTQKVARRIGRAFGVDVHFFGGSKQGGGSTRGFAYTDKGKRIWVSADRAAKGILSTVGHEILHKMRTADSGAFRRVLRNTLERVDADIPIDEFMDVAERRYGGEAGEAIKVEEAMTTIVNDAFENPRIWDHIAQEATLAKPLREAVDKAYLISKRHLTTREANFYKEALQSMAGVEIGQAQKDFGFRRQLFAEESRKVFGEKADRYMPVMEARARVWSRETGKDPDEFFEGMKVVQSSLDDLPEGALRQGEAAERLGDIKRGKDGSVSFVVENGDLPISKSDPIVASGRDFYMKKSESTSGYSAVLNDTQVRKFKSYKEAEEAIEDFMDVLEAKYGREEVLNAPTLSNTGGFANLPVKTKLSADELSELRKLFESRDEFAAAERATALKSVDIPDGPIEKEWLADQLDELYRNERYKVAMGHAPQNRQAFIDDTYRQLFADALHKADPSNIIGMIKDDYSLDNLRMLAKSGSPTDRVMAEKYMPIAKQVHETLGQVLLDPDVQKALPPAQIKSVNNRGTFDPSNPDILFHPAFHGSPHRFDKFSLHKIGSGEGAQAYGWGLYFTDTKEIGKSYKKNLTRHKRISEADLREYFTPGRKVSGYGGEDIVEKFDWNDGDWSVTVRGVEGWSHVRSGEGGAGTRLRRHATYPTDDDFVKTMGRKPDKGGALYEVDLAPKQDEYLLWDEPISKQSKKVREALADEIELEVQSSLDDFGSGHKSEARSFRYALERSGRPKPEDISGAELYLRMQGGDMTPETIGRLLDSTPGVEGRIDGSSIEDNLYDAIGNQRITPDDIEDTLKYLFDEYIPEAILTDDPAERSMIINSLIDTFRGAVKNHISPEEISRTLRKKGVRGIKYSDGFSRGKSKGSYNYVIFDDADVAIQNVFRQEGAAGAARGAVEFRDNEKILHAFESADISTLVHETAHIFRRDLPDKLLVSAQDAIEKITGSPVVDSSGQWTREAEEAFAAGFEAYMREGKAPIAELRSVFEKFKEWLREIYKSISSSPSSSQDLNRVFESMLGADDVITDIHIGIVDTMLNNAEKTRAAHAGRTDAQVRDAVSNNPIGRNSDRAFINTFQRDGSTEFQKLHRDGKGRQFTMRVDDMARSTVRSLANVADRFGTQIAGAFDWRVMGSVQRAVQKAMRAVTGRTEELYPAIDMPVAYISDQLRQMGKLEDRAMGADIRRAVELDVYDHLPEQIQEATRNLRTTANDIFRRMKDAGIKVGHLEDYINWFARGLTPEVFKALDNMGNRTILSSGESFLALKGEGRRVWMARGAVNGTVDFNDLTGDSEILNKLFVGQGDSLESGAESGAELMRKKKMGNGTGRSEVDGRVPYLNSKDDILLQRTGSLSSKNGEFISQNEFYSRYELQLPDGDALREMTPEERYAKFQQPAMAVRRHISQGEARNEVLSLIEQKLKSKKMTNDELIAVARELSDNMKLEDAKALSGYLADLDKMDVARKQDVAKFMIDSAHKNDLIPMAIEQTKREMVSHVTQKNGRLKEGLMPDGLSKIVSGQVKIDDRFDSLSGWIVKNNLAGILEAQGGMFRNNPLVELHNRLRLETFRISVAEKLPDMFSGMLETGELFDSPIGRGAAEVGGRTLDSVFDELFQHVDRTHVYEQMQHQSKRVDMISRLDKDWMKRVGNMMLEPKVYEDLKTVGDMHRLPHSMEGLANLMRGGTALFKAGVLTAPARYTRDLISGQTQSYLAGFWSFEAGVRAKSILFNQEDTTLVGMPQLRAYAEQLGMKKQAFANHGLGDTVQFTVNDTPLWPGGQRILSFGEENGERIAKLEDGTTKPVNQLEVLAKEGDWFTPRMATDAARAAYGSFKESGHHFRRDPNLEAPGEALGQINIADQLVEALPGTHGQSVGGVGSEALRAVRDGSIDPFNVEGVPYVFDAPSEHLKGQPRSRSQTDFKEFGLVTAGNLVGKNIDDMNRLVPWIEGMRQGMSAQDAFKNATRIQLDYRPKTFGPLERTVLKKIFPFYSFFSRESVFLANELIRNPAGRLGKALRAQHHATNSGQDEDQPFMPEHVRSQMAIPWGQSEEGGATYLTGLGMMHEDPLSTILGSVADPQGGFREAIAKMTPLIKAPTEYGLGVSSFQGGPMGGRPLHQMDPAVGRILTNIGARDKLPNNQPAPFINRGVEHLLSNSPLARVITSLRTLTSPSTHKTIGQKAAILLTGVRFETVSPEAARWGKREILNKLARDLGGRSFSDIHLSKTLREETAKVNPEEGLRMEAIAEIRKRMGKERRDILKLERAAHKLERAAQ